MLLITTDNYLRWLNHSGDDRNNLNDKGLNSIEVPDWAKIKWRDFICKRNVRGPVHRLIIYRQLKLYRDIYTAYTSLAGAKIIKFRDHRNLIRERTSTDRSSQTSVFFCLVQWNDGTPLCKQWRKASTPLFLPNMEYITNDGTRTRNPLVISRVLYLNSSKAVAGKELWLTSHPGGTVVLLDTCRNYWYQQRNLQWGCQWWDSME